MFNYWLLGFVGGIGIAIGAIMMLLGIFKTELFVFGIVICAAGSYMRYISRQTNQDINGKGANSSVSVSIAGDSLRKSDDIENGIEKPVRLRIFTDSEAVLENDAFKIFLIKYYGIHKDSVLEKYVFKERLFENLNETLIEARNFYINERG